MTSVYKTEGIILAHYDIGEADKLLNVFTRDFGKIGMVAQGVRLPKSKLKGHINTGSHARFMFVSTKESFRLTDIEEYDNLLRGMPDVATECEARASLRLVDRMVQGSEKDERVWMLLSGYLGFLKQGGRADYTGKVFGTRLLHRLGYIDDLRHPVWSSLINADSWDDAEMTSSAVHELSGILEDGIYASSL